jgi:hypothetical protein
MPSKYAKLRDSLPHFQHEQTFQDKVNAVKTRICGENPEDANVSYLASELLRLKSEKEQFENCISNLNIQIEAASQLIIERMQSEEIEKISLSNGSTCYLAYEVYPSIKNKSALIDWVKKHKMSSSLALPWQTLRGVCNEFSLAGKPLPEGVEAYIKVSARIRSNGE